MHLIKRIEYCEVPDNPVVCIPVKEDQYEIIDEAKGALFDSGIKFEEIRPVKFYSNHIVYDVAISEQAMEIFNVSFSGVYQLKERCFKLANDVEQMQGMYYKENTKRVVLEKKYANMNFWQRLLFLFGLRK